MRRGNHRNFEIENRLKRLLLLAAALVAVMTAHATLTFNWQVNQTVPDNHYSGWVNNQNISGQSGTISSGSLLVHDNVSLVLLDRVGYTGSNIGQFLLADTSAAPPVSRYYRTKYVSGP